MWQTSDSSDWNDAAFNMTTLPEMRDLAHRLLACEANADNTSESAESATLRVYEKLRQGLGTFAGSVGFQSLAFRALTLARLEVASLSAVQVSADGHLQGMSEIAFPIDAEKDWALEGGVVLISHILGLLLIFLGEVLTMNLLRDMWPDALLEDCNSENGRKA